MDAKLREEVAMLHAQICSGLADPNRILLLYILIDGDHNVTDLACRLSLPQPSVSRHLKILRECGIVRSERKGHSVYYRLTDERIIQALDLLRSVLAQHLEEQTALARTASEFAF